MSTTYKQKERSLEECLALIENGDIIAVSGVTTEPVTFLQNLQTVIPRLMDVTVIKSKDNEYDYMKDPATKGHVETIGHFYGPAFRDGHKLGITSYIPSDLHNYMAERVRYRRNNVFVAKVAPPENGMFQIPYCQMFEREAFACADKVILEVNPRFRRVRGAQSARSSSIRNGRLRLRPERSPAFWFARRPIRRMWKACARRPEF